MTLLALVHGGLGSSIREAQAQEVTIEVTTDQIVSVSGRGPSVRTIVEDVCYRAGVEILSYDAEDRAYGGTYSRLPISIFFERIFRDESFLVEAVRVGETDRVRAIRVLGDPTVAAARRARGAVVNRIPLQVPPGLVSAAFSDQTTADEDQAAALEILGARIAGDRRKLEGFLSTDARLIAQAVQRHKGAEGALRQLQHRYPDPRISQKIDEIIVALKELPRS